MFFYDGDIRSLFVAPHFLNMQTHSQAQTATTAQESLASASINLNMVVTENSQLTFGNNSDGTLTSASNNPNNTINNNASSNNRDLNINLDRTDVNSSAFILNVYNDLDSSRNVSSLSFMSYCSILYCFKKLILINLNN
jgi:hypothetical protein